MTNPDAFLQDVAEGVAILLNAAGIGQWPAPPGGFALTDTGIGMVAFPDSCDRAIAITPYPLSDDPTNALSDVGVQIRFRSAGRDIRECWRLDSKVKDLLVGRGSLTLPTGIRVANVGTRSAASLGQEDGGKQRWLWTSNYPLEGIHAPTVHRH